MVDWDVYKFLLWIFDYVIGLGVGLNFFLMFGKYVVIGYFCVYDFVFNVCVVM